MNKLYSSYRNIPALLLAAGKGTRLAPLTDGIPKCLAPINGRPLLDFWLERCVTAEMAPIIINTHYLAESVVAFVQRSPWRDKVILTYEQELLGTGGTLSAHAHLLQNGPFFVAHADNLSFFTTDEFLQAHMARPTYCLLTMMLFRTPTPHSCGIVTTDSQGVVTEFHEKPANPPGDLANGAVYIMQPDVFSLLKKCRTMRPDISIDLLPQCIGRMATYLNKDYHRDIGTMESYAAAQHDMLLRSAVKE